MQQISSIEIYVYHMWSLSNKLVNKDWLGLMNKAWIWHSVQDLFGIFPRNIKSIHIPRHCWEFLFPFIDVFLTSAVEQACRLGRGERGGHQFRDVEYERDIHCVKCKYIQTFHYMSQLLIICCESPRALIHVWHSLVILDKASVTFFVDFYVHIWKVSVVFSLHIQLSLFFNANSV